jgi:hypothetical protein
MKNNHYIVKLSHGKLWITYKSNYKSTLNHDINPYKLSPCSHLFPIFLSSSSDSQCLCFRGEQEAPPDKDVGTGRASITVSGAGVYVLCYTVRTSGVEGRSGGLLPWAMGATATGLEVITCFFSHECHTDLDLGCAFGGWVSPNVGRAIVNHPTFSHFIYGWYKPSTYVTYRWFMTLLY